jgi:hypothetical protein
MMVEIRNLQRPTRGKGAPPKAVETHQNLAKPASGGKVPLQLKISPELRREFKAYAVERDSEVSTLFAQVWDFYRQHHG